MMWREDLASGHSLHFGNRNAHRLSPTAIASSDLHVVQIFSDSVITSLRSRRERELSVTDNSQGRAVMKHYGHRGLAALVKTAQSIELFTGSWPVQKWSSSESKSRKLWLFAIKERTVIAKLKGRAV
jgi:hypothetical protein